MGQAGYSYQTDSWAPPLEDIAPQTKRVKKIVRTRKNRRSMIIKSGVFLFLYALLLVYICIKGAGLGYQIVALEKEIDNLTTANARLEYEIAEATALGNIEKLAFDELGMHKADLKLSRVVDTPGENKVMQLAESNVQSLSSEKQGALEKVYHALLTLAERNDERHEGEDNANHKFAGKKAYCNAFFIVYNSIFAAGCQAFLGAVR